MNGVPERYARWLLAEYDHWRLFLHTDQFPYIGRCYAAAKRSEADFITDILPSESNELMHIVIPAWNEAIKALFRHDRPNVAILGNEWRHLHAHLIPRYHTPRTFYGIEFVDPNPKGNYSPFTKREISDEILLKVKEDIKAKL